MGSQAPLGKGDLFHTPGASLPGYIREIARALMRDSGKSKSQAIQIAIGVVKNWAEGKGKGVNADTRAKAAKAVAEWEAAKAKAHATPNKSDLSNPVYAPGHVVLLAQAPEPGAKKKEKKPPEKGDGRGGKQQFKHGWIPVDENGKPTGPAQKPAWLKKAEDAHKAAGGRTAEQIQAEKASNEFKARARKAGEPARKAKAAAEKKARESKAAAHKTESAKKHAEVQARTKAHAKERADAKKKAERDKQVNAAYKQALADRKAGRELSEQQRRVVAYVEARQKKEQARLRTVDVPGADGSKVAKKSTAPTAKHSLKASSAAKPVRSMTSAAPKLVMRSAGTVTSRLSAKRATKVRARSFTRRTGKGSHRGGSVTLSNDGVNVLDFAGSSNPLGHLAFRYKHGWILINPAIPSRGRMGGGIAVKHGHKSGTVTHGSFQSAPGGKGKVFVPSRSGGENNPAKLKATHTKNITGAPHEKDAYTTAAAQKDSGHNVLSPKVPSPAELKAKKDDATKAAIQAQKSKSYADAQVAAKKYADSFVAHKKAGETTIAEHQKSSAQSWAKKAQQIKAAEKASADMKKKYEAEQKAKAAEEKAKAEKAEAEKKAAAEELAKAKVAKEAALKFYGMDNQPDDAKQTLKKHALANPDMYAGISQADFDKIDNEKAALSKASAPSAPPAKKTAAKKTAAAPDTGAGPGMSKQQSSETKAAAIAKTLDEIPEDVGGSLAGWDDYLHATATYKADPTINNLKKMSAAKKNLTSQGVTAEQIQDMNLTLNHNLTPKKKKTAAKKTASPGTQAMKKAEYLEAYEDLLSAGHTVAAAKLKSSAIAKGFLTESDFPEAKAATPAKAKTSKDWEISLPGPGMQKDGAAIKALMDTDVKNPLQAGYKNSAVKKALDDFKKKHGVEFTTSKVETPVHKPFVPSGGDHISEHPFYNDAKAAGYNPVPNHVNANNGWKPSDVPGLASNKGVYTYSGGAYTSINAQLRHGAGVTGGDWDDNIAQMDKEFAAVPPLADGIVTIRKMNGKGPFQDAPPYMQPGGVFVDPGYSSTSKDPNVWSGDTHMQIRIPAGSHVLDLNHTAGSQHSSEQEILINRGAHYKVISDGPGHSGNRLIVVELVPGPTAA